VPEFKKFRADLVALGNVVASAPLIRAVSVSASGMVVSWFATEGTTYRLQANTTLDAAWIDVPGDVLATDAFAQKAFLSNPDSPCFFRVIAVR